MDVEPIKRPPSNSKNVPKKKHGLTANIFIDFAQWSTVCGLVHMTEASTRPAFIFWVIVFIILLLVFLYQLAMIIIKYIQMPSTVNTDIFYTQLPFPVVTVCNSNPYKYSIIQNNPKYEEMSNFYDYYLKVINNDTHGLDDTYGLLELIYEYDQAELAKDATAIFSRSLGEGKLSEAMYSFDELITECTFSTRTCYESDFVSFFDPLYGRCFSFNTEAATQNYSATRSGMRFGLKLLLTINQEKPGGVTLISDFLPTSEAAGARVLLTDRDELIDMDSYGFFVGVGYQTSIGMLYESINRAKRPYGHCIDHHTYSEDYFGDVKHSMDSCISGCIQAKTVETCGCASPRLPKLDSQSYCTIDKLSCLVSMKGNQENSKSPNINPLLECGCDPACTEIKFIPTASLSSYPMLIYYPATPSPPSKHPPTTTTKKYSTTSKTGWPWGTWPPWFTGSTPTPGSTTSTQTQTPTSTTTTADSSEEDVEETTPAGFIVTTFGCDGHTSPFDAQTETNTTAIRLMQQACRVLNWWQSVRAFNLEQWYKENALILQIYFSDLKYNVYTETAAYSISAAINDLGGQAGLWLGLSVISCIEVISLFAILGMFCSWKTKKQYFPKKRRDSLSDEEFDPNVDQVEKMPQKSANSLQPPLELRPEKL